MQFEKLNILKLNNGRKIIILEKLVYNNTTYIYADDVNEDETDTLDNYFILRVNSNGSLCMEDNPEVLQEIIPLFNRLVKESYER